MVETQYNREIQVLHSDNGKEYQSIEFQCYFKE